MVQQVLCATLSSHTPMPGWIWLLPERSCESRPLPCPLQRLHWPGHSLPSLPMGASSHPPCLDPLTGSKSHPLPCGFGSTGAQCFMAPTLGCLCKPHKTSLHVPLEQALGCIVHQGWGTWDLVLSRGSEHRQGACTLVDASGGSPGWGPGSDSGMVWDTKAASLLVCSTGHPFL